MTSPLQHLDIFELRPLITNFCCKLSTVTEYNEHRQLLCLVAEENDIVLRYTNASGLEVLKLISWFRRTNQVIHEVCFDPSGTWLLVLCFDNTLHILPALAVVDKSFLDSTATDTQLLPFSTSQVTSYIIPFVGPHECPNSKRCPNPTTNDHKSPNNVEPPSSNMPASHQQAKGDENDKELSKQMENLNMNEAKSNSPAKEPTTNADESNVESLAQNIPKEMLDSQLPTHSGADKTGNSQVKSTSFMASNTCPYPLSVVWWRTSEGAHRAIVGYSDGSICFVDLSPNCPFVASTTIETGSVVKLVICRDITFESVLLLITSSLKQQFKLLLEQKTIKFTYPGEISPSLVQPPDDWQIVMPLKSNNNHGAVVGEDYSVVEDVVPKTVEELPAGESKIIKKSEQSLEQQGTTTTGNKINQLPPAPYGYTSTANSQINSNKLPPPYSVAVNRNMDCAPITNVTSQSKNSSNQSETVNTNNGLRLQHTHNNDAADLDDSNGIAGGIFPAARARLASLKSLGSKKLNAIKMRLSDNRQKLEEYMPENAMGSFAIIDSPSLVPELLIKSGGSFYTIQSLRGTYLLSALHSHSNSLSVHSIDINLKPLFLYKIPHQCVDILISSNILYSIQYVDINDGETTKSKNNENTEKENRDTDVEKQEQYSKKQMEGIMEHSDETEENLIDTSSTSTFSEHTSASDSLSPTNSINAVGIISSAMASLRTGESDKFNKSSLLSLYRFENETVLNLHQMATYRTTTLNETISKDDKDKAFEYKEIRSPMDYVKFYEKATAVREEYSLRQMEIMQNEFPKINFDPCYRLERQLNPFSPVLRPIVSHTSNLDQFAGENNTSNLEFCKSLIETYLAILIYMDSRCTNNGRLANALSTFRLTYEDNQFAIESTRFKPISAGCAHCACIVDGIAYFWGSNGVPCNYSVSKSSDPPEPPHAVKKLELLAQLNLEIHAVKCGRQHTLILTNNGLYSLGNNNLLQLGIGAHMQMTLQPMLVRGLDGMNITILEAGQYHNAVVANGHLLTWGWGIYGQLGHGGIENVAVPSVVDFFKLKEPFAIFLDAALAGEWIQCREFCNTFDLTYEICIEFAGDYLLRRRKIPQALLTYNAARIKPIRTALKLAMFGHTTALMHLCAMALKLTYVLKSKYFCHPVIKTLLPDITYRHSEDVRTILPPTPKSYSAKVSVVCNGSSCSDYIYGEDDSLSSPQMSPSSQFHLANLLLITLAEKAVNDKNYIPLWNFLVTNAKYHTNMTSIVLCQSGLFSAALVLAKIRGVCIDTFLALTSVVGQEFGWYTELNACLYNSSEFIFVETISYVPNIAIDYFTFIQEKMYAIRPKVLEVSHAHSVVLCQSPNETRDTELFVFGSNHFGQLGLGSRSKLGQASETINNVSAEEESYFCDQVKCLLPQKIEFSTANIRLIHTKFFTNLAVDENGCLYTWGSSPQALRLANQIRRRANAKQKLEEYQRREMSKRFEATVNTASSSTIDSTIDSSGKVSQPEKKNVSATTIATEETSTSSCTINKLPPEGIVMEDQDLPVTDNIEIVESEVIEEILPDEKNPTDVDAAAVQKKSTETLEKSSTNAATNTINPAVEIDMHAHMSPHLVDTSEIAGQILQVSSGLFHFALISSSRTLYTWGKNLEHQLGTEDKERRAVNKPSPIDNIENPMFVDCGADFTLVMSTDYVVRAFGGNSNGQCGRDLGASIDKMKQRVVCLPTTKRLMRFESQCIEIPVEINLPRPRIRLGSERVRYLKSIPRYQSYFVQEADINFEECDYDDPSPSQQYKLTTRSDITDDNALTDQESEDLLSSLENISDATSLQSSINQLLIKDSENSSCEEEESLKEQLGNFSIFPQTDNAAAAAAATAASLSERPITSKVRNFAGEDKIKPSTSLEHAQQQFRLYIHYCLYIFHGLYDIDKIREFSKDRLEYRIRTLMLNFKFIDAFALCLQDVRTSAHALKVFEYFSKDTGYVPLRRADLRFLIYHLFMHFIERKYKMDECESFFLADLDYYLVELAYVLYFNNNNTVLEQNLNEKFKHLFAQRDCRNSNDNLNNLDLHGVDNQLNDIPPTHLDETDLIFDHLGVKFKTTVCQRLLKHCNN
uniref:Uncharacterized protein n=1 Tax=Glossina brevipalpis TaxID=37001 RepID=A0A1A9WJQ0_9MUSC